MPNMKRLETIYYNGQANGIRTVRVHLSTMTAFVIPRALLTEAKKIKEINNQGIYYLINEDGKNNIVQIYVGQTRNGVIRLDDHKHSKDFWSKAIMFLSDSQTFTQDMLNSLESYCINKAYESNRYKVENKIIPKFEMGEYEQYSVEKVYEEIKFIMDTQGYKLETAIETISDKVVYRATRNAVEALGVYDGEYFEVLENSRINMNKKSKCERYNELRKELLDNKKMIEENGEYILKTSLRFKSPSGASDFVLGGSTNGWIEWKDSNNKTLDELIRKN